MARWNSTADTELVRATPLSSSYSAAMENELYRDKALGVNLKEKESA